MPKTYPKTVPGDRVSTEARFPVSPRPVKATGGILYSPGDWYWRRRGDSQTRRVSNAQHHPNGPDGWVEECAPVRPGDTVLVREPGNGVRMMWQRRASAVRLELEPSTTGGRWMWVVSLDPI